MKSPTTWFRGLVASIAGLLVPIAALAQNPGTLDAPFNPVGISGGAVVSGYPGGKVVVSGPSLFLNTGATLSIRPVFRLLDTGAIDPTLTLTNNANEVNGHVVTADGRLLLYGRFASFNNFATQYLVRLNDDGTVDTGFKVTAPAFLEATGVIPLANGGAFVALSGGVILKLGPDGAKDPSFTEDPTVPTLQLAIALQPSGKLLVVQNGVVFRLDASGKRDTTYANTAFPNVVPDQRHVAVTPDGSLYVTSNTQPVNGGALRTLARLLPDGGVDPSFKFVNDGPTLGSRSITAFAVQVDGRLVVQGQSMSPANLFRIKSNGDLDPTFVNNSATVNYLALEPGGKVLCYGSFLQFSPTVVFRTGLYRLLNDGTPTSPLITGQPAPLTVNSGQPATFAVSAVGTDPLSYRWQFKEADIAGATAAKLTLPAATSANAGSYRVIVSNPNGSVTSAPVDLTVVSAPSITQQPVGFNSLEGVPGSLVAAAVGEQPLAFQWFRNDAPVDGATAATLQFPSLTAANAGNYRFVASNAFGSATSSVARVVVYPSRPDWLVATNATTALTFSNLANPFRPDNAIRIVPDAPRGVVVLYGKGVERWNDAGERVWSARYVEPDFGTLDNLAVDASGNVFVSGIIHFDATLGDMAMSNNSSVTGPNGHKQAFVAKLDPDGHGLWYRLYEAAGPRIGGITTTPNGDVVFVGGNGGKVGQSKLGTLGVFEDAYAGGVAGRIGADGTPKWFKGFPQFTVNRSTCEVDSVAADETGIYVCGLISFSVQFGTIQVQGNGHFLGKLDNDGVAQWAKLTGGTAGQDDPIALAAGHLWLYLARDRTLQHWNRDGGFLTSFLAHSTPGNVSVATLRTLSVTATGEPVLAGVASGAVTVGSTVLDVGLGRPQVWCGRWDSTGTFKHARTVATTTNSNPSIGLDTVSMLAVGASPAGDVYFSGGFANAMRLMGTDVTVPKNGYNGDFSPYAGWLAKRSANAFISPLITQQPIPSFDLRTGDNAAISVKATGPGTLAYQWRKDGKPVPNATAATQLFAGATVADSGLWDCVVSNEFGSATSTACRVTVAPPFTVRYQPAPQLVLLNGAVLSGAGIDGWAVRPGSLLGKTLSFVITNTTSPRFPLGGTFTMALTGVPTAGSYAVPAGGALGQHAGSWFPSLQLPEVSDIMCAKFEGTDSATFGFAVGGAFDLHYDIVAADGCCAQGTFGISGGTAKATFTVTTTTFVPAGNYQWTKDGVPVGGATSATLTLNNVTAADQGIYRCVITYNGYTETTEPAALQVVDGGTVPPPVLTFSPFTVGASGLTLPTWPAGFVLQRATSLSAPDWQTIATQPPVTIPFSQPGEFFRLVPAP